MGECGSCSSGAGPFSEGRELVEFVSTAHDGAIKDLPISSGVLATKCQGCGESFTLETYVGKCPKCGGVHAVSPPRSDDPANIQFAGADFKLP
jgi:rRNA maturation protein Nop10